MEFIYVYVTTATVSPIIKTQIQTSKDKIICIDRSNIQEYIPTNLLPYLLTPSNEEIKMLEFMELNNIKRLGKIIRITIADMKEILKFLQLKSQFEIPKKN